MEKFMSYATLGEFVRILKDNGIETDENHIVLAMRRIGHLYLEEGTGKLRVTPDDDIFYEEKSTISVGNKFSVRYTPLITEKGQAWAVNLLKEQPDLLCERDTIINMIENDYGVHLPNFYDPIESARAWAEAEDGCRKEKELRKATERKLVASELLIQKIRQMLEEYTSLNDIK